MDIVALSDFLRTEAGHGHTLEEICRHFDVSESTARRGVAELGVRPHIDLRRDWRGRKRVYRVLRSAFEGHDFPRAETLSLIELRLAAQVMSLQGWDFLANQLAAHVEQLMSRMARARRQMVEREVMRMLAHLDVQHVGGTEPIRLNQTAEALHLAILGGRTIELSVSGRSMKGKVARIHYAGDRASEVRLEDGTVTPLREIEAVAGLHDLKLRLL